MKSIFRGTAILALAILVGAAGCTQTDFLNPGNYRVTLATDIDTPAGYECVLVDLLELELDAIDPQSTGGARIRAFVPTLGGASSSVSPGVRNVNFSGTTCPIGQCNASAGVCAEDAECTSTTGTCHDSPNRVCRRDNNCPDVGQGSDECDSVCVTSHAICEGDSDCDAGDSCLPPTMGFCFNTFAACMGDADCPGDFCDIRTCRNTETPCIFDSDCPQPANSGDCTTSQKFCQTTIRSCNDNQGRPCNPGDMCLPIDVCNIFNARNAPPTFTLSAGTYRIHSLLAASYSLFDLDDSDNFRMCAVATASELVGVANDDPDDLTFTVGPDQPNQIILTVMDVPGLADPTQTPDLQCHTNEPGRYFDLRDPADGP